MEIKLNSIEEAIEEIKAGKVVIVVDDENRENEGDFVTAAANATTDVINFMATHGRGLICAPLTAKRCDELNLHPMVLKNSSVHETNFTVSVDLIGKGCTTGVSVKDRSKTALALIDPLTQADELGRPGHLFPLKGAEGGVLERAGHTEAAIDLASLADLGPAGIIVEILNDDGTMALLPDLIKVAARFQLKIVSIKDLIDYRLRTEKIICKETAIPIPTKYGLFNLITFIQTDTGKYHHAFVKDDGNRKNPMFVQIQRSDGGTDAFESEHFADNVDQALHMITQNGRGVLLYMNRQANEEFRATAQIFNELGFANIHLLSGNPIERAALSGYGIDVVEADQIGSSDHLANLPNHRIIKITAAHLETAVSEY
ncbi:3,4-dihydroxy-2-butanone-4-phosphate synthase [Mucilaginibacter sp. L196]|uniref:3,4-dihydroxy-2-butanone-4-phosphate synthase n=1 Tax=Mucilaginibacter sp. L196 TaxID=1641870 RepID=UPI00131E58B9|nr:3,4-dihydroxy-2-butanone-4-phosphate synthase [Mucilaginibacter sp. L196]